MKKLIASYFETEGPVSKMLECAAQLSSLPLPDSFEFLFLKPIEETEEIPLHKQTCVLVINDSEYGRNVKRIEDLQPDTFFIESMEQISDGRYQIVFKTSDESGGYNTYHAILK